MEAYLHQSASAFATIVEATVAKTDTWIHFPVDLADFRLPKMISKISLHFHAKLVHLVENHILHTASVNIVC